MPRPPVVQKGGQQQQLAPKVGLARLEQEGAEQEREKKPDQCFSLLLSRATQVSSNQCSRASIQLMNADCAQPQVQASTACSCLLGGFDEASKSESKGGTPHHSTTHRSHALPCPVLSLCTCCLYTEDQPHSCGAAAIPGRVARAGLQR